MHLLLLGFPLYFLGDLGKNLRLITITGPLGFVGLKEHFKVGTGIWSCSGGKGGWACGTHATSLINQMRV